MATKLGLFLAVNLLFIGAAHGCAPYCGPTDPTPPVEPAPSTYTPEPPTPITPATHDYQPTGRCPVDALKLEVCASVLNGLVKVSLPEDCEECCHLLEGLADIDAAACLCTVLKVNFLGAPLRVPVNIGFLLNQCGHKNFPLGFTCPRH